MGSTRDVQDSKFFCHLTLARAIGLLVGLG